MEKKIDIMILLGGIVLGIVILLMYSLSTSPLTYNYFQTDSAFFQGVGKQMTDGVVMYRDIFDEKGPFLFLLEYLGYFCGLGRYGIFLIQSIFLGVSIYLLYRILGIFAIGNSSRAFVLSLAIFFYYFSFTVDGGNLTEEYSLPFLFISFYLFARFLIQGEYRRTDMFVHGICFGLIALLRVTNGVFISVCVLCSFIILLRERGILTALIETVKGIAGIVAAFMPFALYYAIKGALWDMIYATFIFAFQYAVDDSLAHKIQSCRWQLELPLVLLSVYAIAAFRKEYKKVLFLSLSLVLHLFILLLGNAYVHYYLILLVPVIAVFIMVYRHTEEEGKTPILLAGWLVVTLLACFPYFVLHSGRAVTVFMLNSPERAETAAGEFFRQFDELESEDFRGYEKLEEYEDIVAHIPEEDWDSVYSYSGGPGWLLFSGMPPYFKYCQTAESFSSISPKVAAEIDEMFEKNPPKYVITGTGKGFANASVARTIGSEYEAEYQNDLLTLNMRKGAGKDKR